jgi:hypothetical protein
MKIENSNHFELSFVIAGRNDNYGGNFKIRLELCIQRLYRQLTLFNMQSELIFVNYNPLPVPAIEDFIKWPISSDIVQVRIIHVPNQQHIRFIEGNNIDEVPMIEYLAKNIGIRRARGKFIACINPDIIFPDEFICGLKSLKSHFYYRANRLDFLQIQEDLDEFQLFKFAKQNTIAIWMKGMVFKFSPRSTSNWMFVKFKLLRNLFVLKYEFIRFFNFLWSHPLHFKAENKFHCNVSGDFICMTSGDFYKLRGFYEAAPIALHIDALFVVQAAAFGLTEKIVNYPIYHQDHERRYTSDRRNEIEDKAYEFFQKESEQMVLKSQSKLYNNDSWGLNGVQLYEQII